jgi:hypothetical protein
MRSLVLGAVFALWTATFALAATPFDGTWSADTGNEKLTITLAVNEGGKVTGNIAMQGGGDTPIEWGFVKGDLITFRVQRVFQGSPQPFIYIGRIDANQIAFGRRPQDLSLGQLREFNALRTK